MLSGRPDARPGGPDPGLDQGDGLGPAWPGERPAAAPAHAAGACSLGRPARRGIGAEAATAAVPDALVLPTVRVATAAILGGAETGLITGQAVFLARQAMKVMMVGRYARGAAHVFFVTLGAAALAAPLTRPGELARLRNLVSRPAMAPVPAPALALAADRGRGELPAGRLDRSGDPLPSGALVRLGTTQRRHPTGLAGVDFSRDGTAAVTAQDNGIVHFWDAASGRELRTLDITDGATVEDKALRAFALSPDGGLMAAAGFAFDPASQRVVHRVWIRDVKHDRPVREIEVTAVDLYCLAFSPDGATLATGGFGGVVELWDIANGERLAARKLGNAPVRSIAFAPMARCSPSMKSARGPGSGTWRTRARRSWPIPWPARPRRCFRPIATSW